MSTVIRVKSPSAMSRCLLASARASGITAGSFIKTARGVKRATRRLIGKLPFFNEPESPDEQCVFFLDDKPETGIVESTASEIAATCLKTIQDSLPDNPGLIAKELKSRLESVIMDFLKACDGKKTAVPGHENCPVTDLQGFVARTIEKLNSLHPGHSVGKPGTNALTQGMEDLIKKTVMEFLSPTPGKPASHGDFVPREGQEKGGKRGRGGDIPPSPCPPVSQSQKDPAQYISVGCAENISDTEFYSQFLENTEFESSTHNVTFQQAVHNLIVKPHDRDAHLDSVRLLSSIPGAGSVSSVVSLLIRLTTDQFYEVRVEAVDALGARDDVALAVFARALKDGHAGVRLAAVRRMYKLNDEESIGLLLSALSDAHFMVRRRAALCLGWRKVAKAVPKIAELLIDDDASVRVAAANALGSMKVKSAARLLVGAFTDDDQGVREAAHMALRRITGQSFRIHDNPTVKKIAEPVKEKPSKQRVAN